MSRIQYNGNRLIPAPYVSITKNYDRAGDGTVIGKKYNVSVRGNLIAWMGSPSSSGTWHTVGGYPADESISANSRLGALLRKQEALRKLFSVEGLSFEIQSLDGSQPLKFNPRILSIDIPEGIWYDKVEYTINMECDKIYPELDDTLDSQSAYIEDAGESWSLEVDESPENEFLPRTYILRHSVSAKGKKFYDANGNAAPAWQQAKNYVLTRLGFDSQMAISSGVNNLPSYYQGYNFIRAENIDELGGSYDVSETWVLASGSAKESFEISQETNLQNPYTTVTINGEITGLESRDSSMNLVTSKYTNALTKFTEASGRAFVRAQNYSGLTLNNQPLSFTQGKSPVGGTINYSIQYDNRPIKLIEGARSESITINENRRGDIFATIFCIGRGEGPVLQDLGAASEASRALNIELIIDPPTFSDRTTSTIKTLLNQNPRLNPSYSGAIQNVIDAANPINNGYTQSFSSQPQESWDFLTGRYSYNRTWTYE